MRELRGCEFPRVGLFHHHHARVLAQFPGKLAASDIDRVHSRRAARQQYIGKAAGRRADIERDRASWTQRRWIDREMVERESELEAAARHPRTIAAGERERHIFGEGGAGLVDTAPAGRNQACDDQRLRLRPAFGKPALHQQLIGSPLRHRRASPA